MNRLFKKLKGFTLIEVSVVVFILTLVTVAKLKEESRDLRLAIGKAQGQQVKVLKEGLYSYGLKHFNAVINNTAVTGVAVTRAPTVAELKTLGFLNSGFSVTGYYNTGYLTSITPAPAGCPVASCNIQGLVYLNQPLRDPINNAVDGPTLGEAVRQIGADGGASIRTPGTISGLSGGWNVPNPLGATRGILAARIGMGSELDFTAYLRRDGTLPMTGNLNLGGNSVTSLAVVVEGAACANNGQLSTDASGAVVSCQGGLQARQASKYWKDAVDTKAILNATPCNASTIWETRVVKTPSIGSGPRAYTCNGAAWSAVAMDDSGNISVDGTATLAKLNGNLEVTSVVLEGAACSPNGRIARDNVGLILSCQSGAFKKAGGEGGAADYGEYKYSSMSDGSIFCSAVGRYSNRCDQANPKTGACSCPTGSSPVSIASASTFCENPGYGRPYIYEYTTTYACKKP
ncbi:MAG: hypothetical protein CTY35_00285 [Methylotenera sp.]|uniref:shufflon system plasmid conjugative transfer pilus tip adhesin PilV n=1 Tax=Methylotenera sp. TaxID=2051956 RepID=UPI000D4DA257|nr:shufflon system plasmid conjugative transfer pilus tip adhesin PilV [Methylotenera sp.]PPC84793.1 MAG: hypothetical protein CTY38_00285 [Methylotenera sp.]PPD02152.1 MAG: hypothetical protein CTY35_00285 [Methylotenera sp.]